MVHRAFVLVQRLLAFFLLQHTACAYYSFGRLVKMKTS